MSIKPINKWITSGIIISLKTKDKLYKAFKRTGNPGDYKKYKKILDAVI